MWRWEKSICLYISSIKEWAQVSLMDKDMSYTTILLDTFETVPSPTLSFLVGENVIWTPSHFFETYSFSLGYHLCADEVHMLLNFCLFSSCMTNYFTHVLLWVLHHDKPTCTLELWANINPSLLKFLISGICHSDKTINTTFVIFLTCIQQHIWVSRVFQSHLKNNTINVNVSM